MAEKNTKLVAAVDSVMKDVNAAKDRHTKTMQTGKGDEAIVAGRYANAAKNDLAALERIRKRAESGVY